MKFIYNLSKQFFRISFEGHILPPDVRPGYIGSYVYVYMYKLYDCVTKDKEYAGSYINEYMKDVTIDWPTKDKEDVGPYINEDMTYIGDDCLTKDNDDTCS